MSYYIAIYWNSEGWELRGEFFSLEEVKEDILNGTTMGKKFKILKEIKIELKDE